VIYLVRHGETTWNIEGRQQGQLDSPLTVLGVAQARAIGRVLRQALPDACAVRVEASPLGRARTTAALMCAELGIDPDGIVVAPLLAEHHLGRWQGLTFAEIDARYPGARARREADKWRYVVEGGESYALAATRAQTWLAACTAPVTIAVTHEMMSRVIRGSYAGLAPEETVGLSHAHGRIYRLHDGRVAEVARNWP
jgi:probable phosphoglycerate mutase